MAQKHDSVRFKLTPVQREEIKKRIGKEAETLELTAEELEERIAPCIVSNRGA